MSDVTVRQLAQVLGIPVDKLLAQLSEAGMKFTNPDQVVTSTEKVKLLGFLRRTHGKKDEGQGFTAPRQITLKRRQVGEITIASGAAKGKTVNVEVRQKRTYVKRSEVEEQKVSSEIEAERERALKLLAESRARNEQEQRRLEELDQMRRAELEAQRREQEARRRAEEEAAAAAAEAARLAELEAARLREEEEARAAKKHHHELEKKDEDDDDDLPSSRSKEAGKGGEPPHRHKGAKGSTRMIVTDFADDDLIPVSRYLSGELHLPSDHPRRIRKKPRPSKPESRAGDRGGQSGGFSRPIAPIVREVAIGDSIVVADLATKLALKGADVVKALFKMGVMATINQTIDHDTAVLVVEELGHKAYRATENDAESALAAQLEEEQGERKPRPPVVTIMGHVDHGKTSLLDYIRRTKVAAGEAGGITQHIGAYHVETAKGVITFLDTPGHAAFTQMRARGAKLTDIVVLVVAADDGVMPQTIEAIQHARAAKVPMVVAINKIDKNNANPERVKQELLQQGVVAEEFGGDTMMVPVSAKTGSGVDALLEAILLQAEVMELRAVATGRARGTVVESSLDRGRGPVATVLVQSGTLRKGDFLVCGIHYGRVRALFDETGRQVGAAGPSIPVVLLGLSGVPDAGDDFIVVADERLAKDVAQQREQKRRESRLVKRQTTKMEDVWSTVTQGDVPTLNLVIKADVQGSVEALREALSKLSTDAIKINVIGSGVGSITESDAMLAVASKAVLIGFNVRADGTARKIVQDNGLDLRYFSIIYDVIDQVKQIASGLLGTEVREEIIGVAEVREVFRSSKFGQIAGCMVIEGAVKRNKPIRVLRDNVVIFQGELESLRRFKDAVEEVRNGMECGIGVKQYNDVRVGDLIECFERVEVQRTL